MSSPYNTSSILSHKRERSLGFFSDDEDQLRNPASISISSMDELLPPNNNEENSPGRRQKASNLSSTQGRASSGEEVEEIDKIIESGTASGGKSRRVFLTRAAGATTGAPVSYLEGATQSLLTPQSATFSPFSSSDPFGVGGSHTVQDSPSVHQFSTSPPSPFQQHHYPGHRSSSSPSNHDESLLYSPGALHSPQPPSLSPMTISGSTFAFDQSLAHGSGTPITPVSPYSFSHSAPIDPLSHSPPNNYAASHGSDDSPSTVYTDSDSTYAPYAPAQVRRSPSTRQTSSGATRLSTQHEDEHPRARLKRSHSEKRASSMETHDIYAHARLLAQEEAAFIGPQTEVDAAASAATAAASKTGAGAGAFVYKVYHMLLEKESQDLISFTPCGSSFVVTNTVLFSRDVLPKHFKHSNFSSFVRQLNMYGFHKVNKTPRGQARNVETQAWEFTHPKFIRGRPQQLDEIKRKPSESDAISIPKISKPSPADSIKSENPAPPYPHKSTPPIIFAPTPKRPDHIERNSPSSSITPYPSSSHVHLPHPYPHPPHPHLPHVYGLPSTVPQQFQPYPSPQSVQQSPHQGFPPLAHAHSHPSFREPLPPTPGNSLHERPSAFDPLPGSSRVSELEHQKAELQEGYDVLQRDLMETRRRQDQLIDLVKDMHSVLQQTGSLQMLPYTFPSHLFAPGTFEDHPVISITSAAFHRHLPPPASFHEEEQYADSYSTLLSSFDNSPTSSTYTSSTGHVHDNFVSPTFPPPSHGSSAYAASRHSAGLVVDTTLAGAMRSSSRGHTSTLAPPVNAGPSFVNAINTPLPMSPLVGNAGQREAIHALVGLGLGGDVGSYYAQENGREDVEMNSSTLSGYADSSNLSYQSPSSALKSPTVSSSSHPRSSRGPPSPYGSRNSSARRSRTSSSTMNYTDSTYVKREEDVASILASSATTQGLRLAIP